MVRIFSRCGGLSLLVLGLLNITGMGWCGEEENSKPIPVAIVFENDLFAGEDGGYTSGVVLTLPSSWHGIKPGERANFFTDFIDNLSLIADSSKQRREPMSFGQLMFSPKDIKDEQLVVDDQPYAGLLFGRLVHEYQTRRRGEKFGVIVGIIGPSARAKQTQKIVHRITGSNDPQGWDYQLHDEAAVNIDYEHLWKIYESPSEAVAGGGSDFSTYLGASLGNLATEVDGGVIMRWGVNLSLMPCSVYKGGLGYMPDVGNGIKENWTLFLMAGAEFTYLGYSVFLDGNSWGEESHSVSRIPEQVSVFCGFGMGYERFRLNMFLLRGTDMFREQRHSTQYGSLTLGWVF